MMFLTGRGHYSLQYIGDASHWDIYWRALSVRVRQMYSIVIQTQYMYCTVHLVYRCLYTALPCVSDEEGRVYTYMICLPM